jgi:hypothetical protein
MIKSLLVIFSVFATTFAHAAESATVHVEPTNLQGPRPLEKQTEAAAIRDYLESWQSLRASLEQNRTDMLDRDFVGNAKDRLTEAIQEQASLGIRTRYQDRAHDIQILFYSPEGLSIQLRDDVEYDVQVLDHEKVQTDQRVRARYIVILTPAEVRWRVRIFQAETQ